MRSYFSYPGEDYLTPGVKRLIFLNVGVFVIQVLSYAILGENQLEQYFALIPVRVVRDFWVWQLVTSGFMHVVTDIWHLVFNMIALFFFGHLVERHYGTRRLYECYLVCAIFAALIHTSHHFVIDTANMRTPALGASGAIMGILAIAAILYPDVRVLFMLFIPMKMRTLIWILIGFDLWIALVANPHHIAATAHLGGVFCGFLYFRYSDKIHNYLNSLESQVVKEQKKEVHSRAKNMRQKVDKLLDKINDEGLSSLTAREKEFLKNASKRYRDDE